MADIQLILEVVGKDDMVKAIKIADRMKAEYKKLDSTLNKNKMTGQQYAKGIQQLDAKYEQLITTTKQLNAVTKQAGAAQQVVGKGANRAGMLAQQAGYQFGDFAVQVQSGTNVMVAAGQQATQLIGTFSMLAKSQKAIMAFSALGVIIPVITGIAAAFMRTRKEAKEAEVQLKSTSEILKELRTSSSDAAKELRVLLGTFKDIADLDTFLKIEAITEKIAQTTLRLEEAKKSTGFRAAGQGALQDKIDALNLEVESLKTANEKRLANEELLETEKAYREEVAKLLEEREKEIEAAEKLAEKRRESIAAFQEQLFAQSEVLDLLELESKFGKDSSAYRAELVAQEADRLNKLLDQKEITEKQAEDALRLYEETLKLTAEMDASVNSAKGLADALREAASAMASLLSFGAGLDKAIDVAAAKVKALKAGADEAVAGRIAGYKADLDVKLADPSLLPKDVEYLRDEYEGKIDILEGYLNEGVALRKGKKDAGGGGGGADRFESELQQLRDFLATEKELLQARFEEKRDTLEMSLQKRLITLEEFKEMELELERKKQSELGAIEAQTQKAKVSAIAGGIVDVLNAAANGNQKLLKMARIVGAAEALINTYRAAAQTLADPLLPFYAKFAAVASVVAAGFGMVNAIKSGSSSGGASGSAATMPSATQAVAQQRVIIEGIDKNSLFTGEQLSNIFDALYKENGDRGLVFEVAR